MMELKVNGIYNYHDELDIVLKKEGTKICGYTIYKEHLSSEKLTDILDYLHKIIKNKKYHYGQFFNWDEDPMRNCVDDYLGDIDKECQKGLDYDLIARGFFY